MLQFRILIALTLCCGFSQSAYTQSACTQSNAGIDRMEKAEIRLLNQHEKLITLSTLIADDGLERAEGYQYVCPAIIENSTILFVYGSPRTGRFHMNNVHAPLEIGFFDAQGLLIKSMLMETYQNNYRPLYGPKSAFQFALEAPIGFFQENGLLDGRTKLMLDSVPLN